MMTVFHRAKKYCICYGVLSRQD